MARNSSQSPNWSTAVKMVAAMAGLVLLGALVLRFHTIIPLFILAGILAFLVIPVVRTLHNKLKIRWGLAANLCFVILVLIIAAASTATGLAVIQQLQALFLTIQTFLADVPDLLNNLSQQTFLIGPWELNLSQFDLAPIAEQLLASIQPALGQLSGILTSLATGAIESIINLIFVLAVSYFLIVDYNRVRAALINIAVPGYEEDFKRLRVALLRIWNAFLRGQLLVVASTGVLTAIVITMLNVRFSLGLGVLGGIAKFVPILGPISAGAIAALVAFFQPTNWFGITPFGHAILVVVCIFFLDQAIDYLLVPRIMGASLNLHPVVVLTGLLVGATLAGVIGLLLSAPTMASLILIGRYTFRKMVDLNPWDPPIDTIRRIEAREQPLIRVIDRIRDTIQRINQRERST
jgi:predicted PurR-regulated permease PerM